jgi:hypothetical protein
MLAKGGTFYFLKLLYSKDSSTLIYLFFIGGNIILDLAGELSMDIGPSSLASSVYILVLGALLLIFELYGSLLMGMNTSNQELVCDH